MRNKSTASRVHKLALVDEGSMIGATAEIGAWTRVCAGAVIGRGCRIGDHVSISSHAVLADRVTIRSGTRINGHVTLDADVVIDSGAVIGSEGSEGGQCEHTSISQGVFVGANAAVYGVSVGQFAVIRAGAIVHADVPPFAIVSGNAAEIVGYARTDLVSRKSKGPGLRDTPQEATRTRARLYAIPSFADLRGSLSVIEWHKQVPFKVKRVFYTYDTPSTKIRGEHAHKRCHQFLIAVAGSLNVIADDGRQRDEFVLDTPSIGLHLPPGIWGVQYKQQPSTVLLVLTSHEYDPHDYIRDYSQFLDYVKTLRRKEIG